MDSDSTTRLAAAAVIVGGVGLVFVHYYAGSPHDPEGWLSAIGFGAPFVGAGVVASVGVARGHAGLMLAAGIAVVPMSLLSIVLIPLVISAGVLVMRAVSLGVEVRSLSVPATLGAALLAALMYLVFHQDPAQWSTPRGSGGSSNIVTSTEALIAIGTATLASLAAATAA